MTEMTPEKLAAYMLANNKAALHTLDGLAAYARRATDELPQAIEASMSDEGVDEPEWNRLQALLTSAMSVI